MTDWTDAIPDKMKDLPRDQKRKVPIPLMNVTPDGTPNFMVVSNETVIECGLKRRCGICGNDLDYWIAFVGGPVSAANGAYTDPPFHVECAEAAMHFCPHLNRKVHRRSPEEKMPEGSFMSEGAIEEKPPQWIIGIARNYEMLRWGQGVLFTCKLVHSRIYEYDDNGNLQKVGES